MAFVVSEGQLRSLDKPRSRPSYSLRLSDDYTADYAAIYRTQPAVRTVASFLGRNIASLGIHVFERVSDTDRRRLTDHPIAALLSRPNPWTTRYRLLDALVQDVAIYDVAYWLKMAVGDGLAAVSRLEPSRTSPTGDLGFAPQEFTYKGSKASKTFDAADVVYFRGYNPTDSIHGCSPIESLRRVLAEEWAAGKMREQMLRNGARFSGYIKRPPTTKDWTDEAFERFKRQWQAQYVGDGPQAGGTPVLEDGMEFVAASQTAEQLQYVEARKLTREEVAAAYHIPSAMVGLMEGATWANITEQHTMLYQDTLGPWLSMISEEIELQLLPDLSDGRPVYVEFNLEEKLRGSFETQATQLQASVGGPWLTRNEARARNNLPAITGGDELIVPLNVLVGGQASPIDSGTQNQRASTPHPVKLAVTAGADGTIRIKSEPDPEHEALAAAVLVKFFRRQRASVLSALGAKAPTWWDGTRWEQELADDLYALAMTMTTQIAGDTLVELGLAADAYSVRRTQKFLRAVAESRAGAINATTLGQLQAALDGDLEDGAEGSTPAGVFDLAEGARAQSSGRTLATTLSGFTATEVGRQLARPATTKTWRVYSGNPRSSHALMDGETVGIDDLFSNAMDWPGDPVGGADEVAGCMCGVEITIP